jgi:hypothetical protein
MARGFTFLIGLLLLTPLALSAQQESEIDASQPTNLYNQMDINAEWQHFEGGTTGGVRLMPTFAPNAKNLVLAEIPILGATWDGLGSAGGIGDLRVRYFTLPYLNPGQKFFAFGPSFDVFMPTGDADKGLGSGAWTFAPGVIFGFRLSDTFTVFPIVAYQLSKGPNTLQAGGDRPGAGVPDPLLDPEDEPMADTEGFSTEVITVIPLPDRQYLQVVPSYRQMVKGNVSKAFNVRVIYGKMLNPRLAFQASYMQEFVNRDALRSVLRAGFSFYL